MPHAKSLIPSVGGLPAVPMLITTTSQPHLLTQLIHYGFTDPATATTTSRANHASLQIDHTRLALVVDGQTILEDEDGTAPDGWWHAVDTINGWCDVWVITHPLDLASPTIGEQLGAIGATPGRSVSALVKIAHTAAHTI